VHYRGRGSDEQRTGRLAGGQAGRQAKHSGKIGSWWSKVLGPRS